MSSVQGTTALAVVNGERACIFWSELADHTRNRATAYMRGRLWITATAAATVSRLSIGILSDFVSPYVLAASTLMTSALATFFLWGFASTTFAPFLVYSIIFGLVCGGFTSVNSGVVKDLVGDDLKQAGFLFGFISLSRGFGNIMTVSLRLDRILRSRRVAALPLKTKESSHTLEECTNRGRCGTISDVGCRFFFYFPVTDLVGSSCQAGHCGPQTELRLQDELRVHRPLLRWHPSGIRGAQRRRYSSTAKAKEGRVVDSPCLSVPRSSV